MTAMGNAMRQALAACGNLISVALALCFAGSAVATSKEIVVSKFNQAPLALRAVSFLVVLAVFAAVPSSSYAADLDRQMRPVNDLIAAALSDAGSSEVGGADLGFARDPAREAAALELALDDLLVVIGVGPQDDPAQRATLMQAVRDTFPMQRIVGELGSDLGLSLDDLGDVATLRLLMLWSMAAPQPIDPQTLPALAPDLRERMGSAAAAGTVALPADHAGRQLLADLTLYALVMDVQINQTVEGNARAESLQERFFRMTGRSYEELDLRQLQDMPPSGQAADTPQIDPASDDAGFDSVWIRMDPTASGFSFLPRMLFDDGTVTRDIGAAPGVFDVAASRSESPDDWGVWRRNGDEFVERFPNDSRDLRFAIPGQMFEAREAPRNLRLDGRYMSLDTMSVPLMGGTQVTAAWQTFEFSEDGRFVNASGASTSAPGMAGHSLPPDQQGQYMIDGHTISFLFDDGREEHRLFFLFPEGAAGDTDTIGVGGTVYVKR